MVSPYPWFRHCRALLVAVSASVLSGPRPAGGVLLEAGASTGARRHGSRTSMGHSAALRQDPEDTQYDRFARVGVAGAANWSAAAVSNLCFRDRYLPELFILGQTKCGTSTLSYDLRGMGVESNNEPEKEFHFFDNSADEHWGLSTLSKSDQQAWLAKHPVCSAPEIGDAGKELIRRRVLADFTPTYLMMTPMPEMYVNKGLSSEANSWPFYFWQGLPRHTNLPAVLRDLYSEAGNRLTFAVMIREPLSLYQATFYFQSWVREQVGEPARHETFESVVREALNDSLNTSAPSFSQFMYARHLEAYLRYFEPRQFYVIPFMEYVQVGRHRLSILSDLSARLGVPLRDPRQQATADGQVRQDHHERGSHPPLADDLPSSLASAFRERFREEEDGLVRLLKRLSLNGGGLGGFSGRKSSETDIRAWLQAGW